MNKQQSLVSCAMDGTICIWDIVTSTIHPAEFSTYFEEILINTDELSEKNRTLHHLESRLNEVISEHSFEVRQLSSTYENKIKQIEETNADEMKILKKRIKVNCVGYFALIAYSVAL